MLLLGVVLVAAVVVRMVEVDVLVELIGVEVTVEEVVVDEVETVCPVTVIVNSALFLDPLTTFPDCKFLESNTSVIALRVYC